MRGLSFLVQSIWYPIIFFYFYKYVAFRLEEFSSLSLVKMFPGPLKWESSISIPTILRFDIFIVSQISWIFCVLLDLTFSFTNVSISSIVSLIPGDACICR